jgi:integrase
VQEFDQQNPFILFEESIKSEATKLMYTFHLKKYLDFAGPEFQNFSEIEPRAIEQKIIEFIISMKQQEHKSYFSIHNHISPVLTFYKINDIVLNVSKIKRYYPSKKRANRDRSYTHEEIQRLLDIADERVRTVILLLASTGMRIGAIPDLRLKNMEKISNSLFEIYRITVYEGFNEEYITFTTPECTRAIDNYLTMRSRYGEKLDTSSWLIREQFDIRDQFAIRKPINRPLKTISLSYKIRDIAIRAGIRSVESDNDNNKRGTIRKEVPIAHGFRKFFTTQLIESDLKTELRWLLEGHNLKANDGNYVRTTAKRLQQEYEKAIDNLTIDPNQRLRKKIETLQIEKSRIDMLEAKIQKIERKYGKIR